MSGFITKLEVQANQKLIVEMWGADFYSACLESEGTTFLALLNSHGKI